MFTTNDFMFEEGAKGMLLDLTPAFNKSRIKKTDYYAASEPQFLRNKLFAMPVDYGVWALWYNVEMLARRASPPERQVDLGRLPPARPAAHHRQERPQRVATRL